MGIFTYPARRDHPELRSFGLATRYFPCYINRKKSLHKVETVLLSFIIRGKAIHYLGENEIKESGPSLSITHFGQFHSIITPREGIEIMNIFFDPQVYPLPQLGAPLDKILNLFLPIHPGFQNELNKIVHIDLKGDDTAVEVVKLLNREFEQKLPGYINTAEALFRLFLIILCRKVLKSGFDFKGLPQIKLSSVAEKARVYIEDNFREKFSLIKVADLVALSPNYLCREFKKHTGKTIFKYLTEKRLQMAMQMLRFTNDKIISIAYESGFSDISFFNRKFKLYTGMSPADYRKKFREYQY
ncbi:MAG TPA: AraC family transcriptional regulator [Victivallales bacterium]|nr:AraC family transcriptional regulator [Victivallales bacterium]HPO90960.1 AraC family transcriptional regulator [Victivallales bacterium]HRR06187.1 AraC family transcriptional regulator [Victivallales bacterium]HRR28190.1 AraC family transcriptional regulator [Victivallales bacterium]HRU01149.1 AraC family transcriptional regulator [Victivallales bacterium]